MKQAKLDSILEALANIAVGAGIALTAQIVWFSINVKSLPIIENLMTTVFFTLISFVRSYGIRRIFNGRPIYQSIKQQLSKRK